MHRWSQTLLVSLVGLVAGLAPALAAKSSVRVENVVAGFKGTVRVKRYGDRVSRIEMEVDFQKQPIKVKLDSKGRELAAYEGKTVEVEGKDRSRGHRVYEIQVLTYAVKEAPQAQAAAASSRLSADDLKKDRKYQNFKVRFFVPQDYDPATRYTAIMTFMGLGMRHVDDEAWPALAREGFVVIVSWPPNNDCRPTTTFKALFQAMAKDVAIDTTKVFSLGFSRWGCASMGRVFAEPDAWRGAIAVCHCYFESGRTPNDAPSITLANQDLRLLVVAGEKDMNTVALQPLVCKYQASGFLMTQETIPGMGHLMRKEEVPLIGRWIRDQFDEKKNRKIARKRKKLIKTLKKKERHG